MIHVVSMLADSEPDCAGSLDEHSQQCINRIALQFVRNDVEYARAMRYALDEFIGGPLFEDMS